MPLPKPKASGQTAEEWMAVCMGHETVQSDFKDQKQRVAFCLNSWREHHGSAATGPKPKKSLGQDRMWSVLEVKGLNEGERSISGMATTPSTDRIGDIVASMGATFSLPIPLLWQHKHDQPVGEGGV